MLNEPARNFSSYFLPDRISFSAKARHEVPSHREGKPDGFVALPPMKDSIHVSLSFLRASTSRGCYEENDGTSQGIIYCESSFLSMLSTNEIATAAT
jgi:hypothetical protein